MSNTRIAEELAAQLAGLKPDHYMHSWREQATALIQTALDTQAVTNCNVTPTAEELAAELSNHIRHDTVQDTGIALIQTALDTQRAEDFEAGQIAMRERAVSELKEGSEPFAFDDEKRDAIKGAYRFAAKRVAAIAITPRTAQQSEAVIASAPGKNLTVVEAPEAIKSLGV